MMRVRGSQQEPRLQEFRFRVGCRICADAFRRVIPTLISVFIALLLAPTFRGLHFAPHSLSIPLGQSNSPTVETGDLRKSNRDALLPHSASGTCDEVRPQKQLQSQQVSVRLPVQADDPDSVIEERSSTQVGDDSNAFQVAFRTKLQGVEVKTPWVHGIKITSNPGVDGIYAAENEIRVTVLFSRAVEVEGRLELSMQVGTEVKQVLYQTGLGTEELVFTYQVVEGDEDSDGVSIEAGSLVHGEGVISGLSGNAALPDHEGLEADPRHRVDGIRPLLVSDKVELDGDQLILPFAEMLDGTSIPKTDDFRVTVSGKSREVSAVVVKVSEVILTLISPAEVGQSIAVSYDVEAQSAGQVLRDQAGNPAEGFINQMVINRTGVALPARAVRQIQAILEAKQKRTPAQRKVDSQLVEEWQKLQGQQGADRMVTVDLRAEVTSEVLERIRELGGTVLNSVERYRSIRAEMPLSEVEALAAHEAVRFIRAADEAATRNRRRKLSPDRLIEVLETAFPRALNTTQGDVAHQVNTARITHSVDGTGIGIGVLSDGVGTLAARQATGDLPSRVTVLPGQHDSDARDCP